MNYYIKPLKDKIVSCLGSILEWYDFALYGFFAPLIAQLYFPSTSSTIGLLKAFSIFAIGFIARPIGALIFGSISDKYGRISCLKITPIIITLPTICFAFLPTYKDIGLLAPIILTILRIWQGICIGGEFATNIVYLCETTNKSRTYFIDSIGACTGSFGIFLASITATLAYNIFSDEYLKDYGWRFAFLISAIFGIIVYILRQTLQETPIFQALIQNDSNVRDPICKSFKENFKDYILACGMTFLPATSFYYVFMFLPSFLQSVLHIDAGKILSNNALSLLIRLSIIPFIGLIADKLGGIKITRLSCILFLCASYPLVSSIMHDTTSVHLFCTAFALLTTINAATTPGLLVKLLDPATRCTMFSFTFNLCYGVFGGIVPLISFLLINTFGNKTLSAIYLMFAASITLLTTFFYNKECSYVKK